ncbi:MAG: HlyD family efflux transporter periplasmic adaptor subunit [Bacteroidetes bacterium]|nr:HlyD family efflux transporter periplasmic adaptor subunit [Bacteroidota bacterium]
MIHRNKHIVFLLSAALISVAGCKSGAAPEAEASAAVQTPVTVAEVTKGEMKEAIQLNATSAFLLKSYIKANANGYLQQASLHIGQLVQRGQPLFSIKTKEAQSIGNAVNLLDSSFRFTGVNSIKAAESGYITSIDHQPGDYVQDGEQLAVISNVNSFAFILNLPYELRPYLLKTRQLMLELPDGEKLQGQVSSILPTVDSVTQTQRVAITVHAGHPIPENLIAKVSILKSEKSSVVSVPKEAVLADETQSSFWIMKMTDSITAVKVPVKKGMEVNGRIEILSPLLTDTDKILVSGHYGLADTAKVNIIPSQQ